MSCATPGPAFAMAAALAIPAAVETGQCADTHFGRDAAGKENLVADHGRYGLGPGRPAPAVARGPVVAGAAGGEAGNEKQGHKGATAGRGREGTHAPFRREGLPDVA